MAVSLKKEQHIREYTPEHLMDEEEAVRKFCPPRESTVRAEEKEAAEVKEVLKVLIEKERGEIATLDEENPPQTKYKISSMEIFLITILIMCGVAILGILLMGVKFCAEFISTGNPELLIKATLCAIFGAIISSTIFEKIRKNFCKRFKELRNLVVSDKK